MSKTLFSSKCQVLGELWLYYREDAANNENWREFFQWADIGLPMAYMAWQGVVTIKAEGEEYVNNAYDVFCEMISIDPSVEYPSLGHAFGASPNAPVSNE